MKRFIIFSICQLIALISPFAVAVAEETQPDSTLEHQNYQWGVAEGRVAAGGVGTGKWFGYGFLGGVTLGPVGTATVAVISQKGSRNVPPYISTQIADRSPSYQEGFAKGYNSAVNRKNLTNSVAGGAVGTVVLGAAIGIAYFVVALSMPPFSWR
jgi:hypothetical protein